ncbi:DUF4258 domain-containing protein [Flagellimonas allohymeniacidonis]|uniref:DUF4258 domain-containing protein n=1 Tax=Flagellimonas allohymeniacidonis TaxID=2517819 RepID=A0A4Q8QKF7_9FLAO|nr:DUF4258 domain-containing protein [Allomuricauda hymeniacidonis]TAI48726.1 DUF4258 domain-containing protein [Allomuricauda hymeniacidonis]
MAFLRRLGWYLVGLSIGIVFLVFFLQKKSEETGTEFCYFPNCRVLKDLRSKPLVFGDKLQETFRDTILIQSFLKDGDIDFRNSDTKSEPCKIYRIEKDIDNRKRILQVQNCKDSIVVESLSY